MNEGDSEVTEASRADALKPSESLSRERLYELARLSQFTPDTTAKLLI